MPTALSIVTSGGSSTITGHTYTGDGVLDVGTINTALGSGSTTLSADAISFGTPSTSYGFSGASNATLTLNTTGAGGFSLLAGQSVTASPGLGLTLNGGATPLDLKAALVINGGALTLKGTGAGSTPGVKVEATVSDAGGAVTLDAGSTAAVTSAGIASAGGAIGVTGGSITLGGDLDASTGAPSAGSVTLTSTNADVSQTTGAVKGGLLTAVAMNGGAVTLTNGANTVSSADLSGASVAFINGAALTLAGAQGTSQGTAGAVVVRTTSGALTLTGAVTAAANASVTLVAGGTGGITQIGGAIAADTVSASAGGAVSLGSSGNMVGSVSLSGAGVSFTDGQDLTVTSATSSGGGALTVRTSGALALAADAIGAAGSVDLEGVSVSGGALTLPTGLVAATGAVSLGALTLSGASPLTLRSTSGNVTLTSATATGGQGALLASVVNGSFTSGALGSGGALASLGVSAKSATITGASSVGAVAATLTAANSGFTLNDGTSSLTVGTVAPGYSGLTTNGGASTLTAGSIGLNAPVNVGTGSLTLNTSGAGGVGQSATITAGTLSATATGGGAVTLTNNGNAVSNAALSGAGVSFSDTGALTLTGATSSAALSVSTTGALTVSGAVSATGAGTASLSGSSVALGASLSAAGGAASLTATGGGVSQTAGAVTTGALSISSSGAVTLTQGGNDFTGAITGSAASASFYDQNGVTLGAFTTSSGALSVAAAGAVTFSGALSTAGGLTVTTPGAATLSGSLAGAGGLTQAGAGALTLQGANTYGGGTTISAGSVVAQNAGSLSTGAVADATSLTYSGASGTVANAVSGAGSLTVAGVGAGSTLTFSGALTQTGGFTVGDASNAALAATGSYAAGRAILTHGGTFTNAGAITVSGEAGVNLAGGGAVVNQAGGAIAGGGGGVVAAAAATLTNAGSITSSGSDGVDLNGGGTVTNGSAAFSAAQNAASTLDGEGTASMSLGVSGAGAGAITLDNYGRVFSNQGSGVGLQGGAALTVNNFAGGVIYGNGAAGYFGYGVFDTAGVLTVNNAGVIAGATRAVYSAGAGASAAVTNSGTIEAGTYDAGSGTITATPSSGSLTALKQLKLSNSGSVIAAGATTHAVFAEGDGSAVLNSGTISTASQSAVQGGVGLTVVNAAGGTLAGGSNATSGYAVEFAGGTGSFDTFGAADAHGRGVTADNTLDGAATGTGVTATLEAGSSTGAIALGGQDDTVNLYTGAVTTAADTRADPVSGAPVTVRAAGTYGAAAFSTIALGGGDNALNLRGAGDQGLQGAAGTLSLADVTAAGGSYTLNKLDTGTWTLTGAAGTAPARINAGDGTASGLLSFNGASGLSAPIYVDGAQISASTAGAFGHGAIYAVKAVVTYGAAGSYDNALSLQSADLTNAATKLQNGSGGSVVLSGAITQANAGAINVDGQAVAANQTLTFAGQAGSTFRLIDSGDSWTGATTVDAGVTLQGSTSTISGGSIVDNGRLSYVDSVDATLSQPISGSGSVVFDNGATYTIAAGTAETYTGATTLAAGVLKLDGSLTSAISVQSYTRLQGVGSTTGAVTVSGLDAVFAPGEGAGTFTAASLSLGGGTATFSESITAAGAGKFVATSAAAGAVNLSGSLTLTYTGGSSYGAVHTLVQATGGGTVTGAFSNAAEGATLTSGGHTFRVNYTSTTVTLTDVTNTAPTLGGSGASTAADDKHAATPLSAVTVSDPDGAQTQTATVSFAAANGTLAGLGTATVSGGVATYSVSGAASAVQGALQAAVFTPTANQAPPGATVQTVFTVNDTDSTGAAAAVAATATLTATSVNDAPALAGTHASSVDDRGADALFSGVTVSDPDTGQTETATISFAAAAGTLAGAGAATTANGVATYTVGAGSAAALAATLQGVVFTPASAPAGSPATVTTVTLTVGDGIAATAADAGTVVTATHTTNTPVVAANAAPAQAVTDASTVRPFAGVTVSDPDIGQTETATITYAAAGGALSGAGLTGQAGDYALSAASATALQAALQALVFTPTPNQVAPGQTVATTFALRLGDGATTADVSDTVTATSVDDAPSLGKVQAATALPPGGAVVLQPGLTLADPDVGAGVVSAKVSISGFVADDRLTVSAPAGVAASYDARTGVLTLSGAASDAAYQGALRTVGYSHDGAVDAGQRTITFSVTDDQGAASTAVETVSVGGYVQPPPGGGGGATAQPVAIDVQQGFAVQIGDLLRASSSDPALSTPTSPLYAQAQAEKAIAAQLDSGVLSLADAQTALYHLVDGTTSVAEIAYAFFTGRTPTAAGLNYLVHSSANPTDLNDGYYQQFTTENRYINFANNLATGVGEGAAAFQANYGSLSLADATAKAYAAIFGTAPAAGKVDAILNAQVSNGLGGTETRAQYFADITGGSAASQKAAAIGFLLADSVKEGFGAYQQADLHFLADLAHGTAVFNVDLLAAYTAAPTLVGQPVIDPTLGS